MFKLQDVPELKRKINTKYAFARKVYDKRIVKSLFS